jgi:hypothetical protein
MITPKSLTLVCKVTGVTVKYTNAAIIKKKCEEAGSVEAFVNNFTSPRAVASAKRSSASADVSTDTAKGAQKKTVVKAKMIKPILLQGKALGEMTSEEYAKKYPRIERTYANKNGEVVTTVCVEPVIVDSIKYTNAT